MKNRRAQSSANRQADALLDVVAVASLLGCSTRTIHRHIAAGLLPSPIKLKANGLARWHRRDIEAAISSASETE